MLKEIHEQPEVIKTTQKNYLQEFFNDFESKFKNLILNKKIIFVGCGTAYHACLVGEYYFNKYTNIDTSSELASELRYKKINKDEKILVIDDLIATGGTAEAAAKLIEISGGSVAGFIFVINLFDLPGNNLLKKKSYFTESIIEFPGH